MTIKLPGVLMGTDKGTLLKASQASAQALTAATAAILAGTLIQLPDAGLVVGAKYKARFTIDKTGAGVATSAYVVGVIPPGDAATAANVDTLLSFTKPGGSAAADVGVVEIELAVLAIGPAAEDGSVVGTFRLTHNLASTGHATVPCVAIAGADATTATITAGLGGGYICVKATTGADDVSNVTMAEATLELPAAA